jgi:CheY-like chemotaxis protein
MVVPSHRPVVLAVEDEPLTLMLAVDMIRDAGFEPLWASNADEAIRILESRDDIRIVFTDINMPGSMDGLKLAQAVRGRWPLVKIIVTSGLSGSERAPCQRAPSSSRSLIMPIRYPTPCTALQPESPVLRRLASRQLHQASNVRLTLSRKAARCSRLE